MNSATQLTTLMLTAALTAACTPQAAAPPVVPAVYVTEVRAAPHELARVLSGVVRPRIESDLAFRLGGKVSERLVDVGQRVRRGQVLARIDSVDYRLALQAASGQLRAAEVDAAQSASDAARFGRLLQDGSVGGADAERQQARADGASGRLTQARSQLELARNRQGYAELVAPFDGVVTSQRLEVGQVVSEGQGVLTVARAGELDVVVDVPEGLAASLSEYQAEVRQGDASNTPTLALHLRELAPSAAASTRTYRARYTIANAPPALRLGATADVVLTRRGGKTAVELPLSALLSTGGPAAVWLVNADSGALTRQSITLVHQGSARCGSRVCPTAPWW
ncbi:efflux RND transporter periplasmic adaptor subunit [Hydrogenophaga sp.]|uniref:efflux RND transporter periplasmic adaptor subunit n=1 Tax=Hydrogenophaga sp. TaxID=1904254 RepID=UPI003AF8A814